MYKTVEAPLSGHPDKICDQIVEAILDEYLRRDPKSRVDLQALGSHGMMMIGGTVDSRADFDCAFIAKNVYQKIGYHDDIELFMNIEKPSQDFAKNMVLVGGASGTAVVHGYATCETREMMPRAVVYANALARRLDDLRRLDSLFSWMCPDGKVQLTLDGTRVVSVTVLVQHVDQMDVASVKAKLFEHAIAPILGNCQDAKIFVNTAGTFYTGGFACSAGASGRKLLADTYGGLLPSGGNSFVGHDPYHPARCGAYMARYVAKNLVAQDVAKNILITVGYTIGERNPIFVQSQSADGRYLSSLVKEKFDFRPEAIVEKFDLAKPIFENTAIYGSFGRDGLPWEKIEN